MSPERYRNLETAIFFTSILMAGPTIFFVGLKLSEVANQHLNNHHIDDPIITLIGIAGGVVAAMSEIGITTTLLHQFNNKQKANFNSI